MVRKLVGAWLLLGILFITAGILWLRPDVKPHSIGAAVAKIVALIALLSAVGFVLTFRLAQTWSSHVRRLQRFDDAPVETLSVACRLDTEDP